MGKIKPARGKKRKEQLPASGAVPCLILVIAALVVFTLLFYAILRST